MSNYNKITALYSRLSVGDEDRDGGESNSIQNQKIFLENYAKGQHLTNIRHYIDDDESGRFFDRSAYSRMIEDVESGKIGVCIMKDLTRWGRDYLQVGNAMEIFRRNNVRFIAVNNGIDSENPDTLEFAPFINIMSEWYAKDISKKVKTGIQPFQVIYQTAEDGLGDTVKPRLIEAAADLDRVLVIDEAKRELTLSDERIEKAIIQNGARLIILDPIQAYMGDKADMNKANEVRPIFRRLAEVAERTGCAVILIGHLNKAAGGQSAYRGLGSIDFRAAARSVLLIGRVKREPNVRVIIHDKSSLAPEGKPVAFCLDPETGFEWIGEYDITADELLSGAGGNNATKTEQAEKLILDLLADGKELASEDIEKAAADAGISARTVRAAKKNLDGRITSKRIGAAWYHALKK